MPTGAWFGLVVALVVTANLALVFGVVVPRLVRASWGKWHEPYPAREPAQGAIRKTFQSFSVGLVNLGFGVHVSVDDEFLHLTPALPARGFGMRAVSIPWDRIEVTGGFPFGRKRALVDGVSVIGPAWCLGLAGTRGD